MPTKKSNKKSKERGALKRAIRKVKAAKATTITAVEGTVEQDLTPMLTYADLPMTAENAKLSLAKVFGYISEQLAVDAPPAAKANAWAVIKDLSQNAEKLKAYGRDAIIQLLKEHGEETEAGSRTLISGGWRLSMRPHRTGLDPKKVEKALREKGMSPESWMTPKVTYSISHADYAEALGADTVADCHYDESWTVAEPVSQLEDSITNVDTHSAGPFP